MVKTSQIESPETDTVNSEKEKLVEFNETDEDQVELVREKIEKETVVERDGSENIGKEVQFVKHSESNIVKDDISQREDTNQKLKNTLQKDSPSSVKAEKSKTDTVRVKVDLLDKLMELTGEIVLGRNQLLQQLNDTSEKNTVLSVAHMISDLQQIVLQTRMQPI